MRSKDSEGGLRANAGIMMVNKAHQYFAGEAYHYPGEWMMPQGGLHGNESPAEAMERELFEETGINFEDVRLIKEHDEWLTYRLGKPLVKDGITYTGQRQKWFLLEYNGPIPDAMKAEAMEFSQFRWVEPQWLIERTAKFKVDVYKNVFAYFQSYLP